MALKVHPSTRAKATRSNGHKKHLAKPASFKNVLKTYGLTQKSFVQLQDYVEKRLGHALAE